MNPAHSSLPFGVFSVGTERPRAGVAVGDMVLDLAGALGDPIVDSPRLNPFLARGPEARSSTRAAVLDLLDTRGPDVPTRLEFHLVPVRDVKPHLPVEVADFVDFHSSLEHASNASRILRPGDEPLKPNWRHLPVGGHLVSTPAFAPVYWTPARQLAHLTSNGASPRTGDLHGTGTISSWDRSGHDCFLELTWNGEDPIDLPGGERRGYLHDHDVVTVSASAPAPDGGRVDFGQVSGRVLPAGTTGTS
ncbi:MAG TPA: hypothetical protein VJT49_34335 [Amycolatopsis sp.]|uniref:hypothetical protein n=1 Tax=Amycolatopsis sp. TaxID=37632 RepID=UPI002B474D35|nr:hypothetical protein [Amycolatopsis sp.]HKS50098.1 hypothetical protein [Amycolatopsis sp.]